MEKILIYIKHHMVFLWSIIERINLLLIKLFYRKKIEQIIGQYDIINNIKEGYGVKRLTSSDLNDLYKMVEDINSGMFKFFKPHAFDSDSLQQVLSNDTFIKFGFYDIKDNRLVGYFILRLFANKKCFIGRLVHPDYQGKGIAKEMAKILYCVGKNIGFNVYSTISKDNLASLSSHKAINNFAVEKELNNGFILIKFDLRNIKC